MGVKKEETVEDVILRIRRRKKHRLEVLNEIEAELINVKERLCSEVPYISTWRSSSGYKSSFSTSETWSILRVQHNQCGSTKGVWFSMATPKFAFMTWLAMLNRLSTMDRISKWS